MSAPRDPDLILADWLDDGPLRLPDQTRRAIAVGLRSTSQRRPGFGRPWRSHPMSPFVKIAGGAIALVLVAAVGLSMLAPPGNVAGPPAPSATGSPTPRPSAAASNGETRYWSVRYSYDIELPHGWTPTPSVRTWTMAQDQHDWLSPAADQFRAPGHTLLFTVFAAPIPAGMSSDDWISTYASPDASSSPTASFAACTPQPVDLGTVTVDGHPASFRREPAIGDCGGTYAFVPVGDRMYVFAIWLPKQEQTLLTFLQSVRFQS